MRKSTAILAGTLLVSGSFISASAGHAADPSQYAGELLESTSKFLKLGISDPALKAQLSEDLQYAIDNKIIDFRISEDFGAEGTAKVANPRNISRDMFVIQRKQADAWAKNSETLKTAFEVVKSEFAACRATPGPANVCAQSLGFKMQLAVANASVSEVEAANARLNAEKLNSNQFQVVYLDRNAAMSRIYRALEGIKTSNSSDQTLEDAKKTIDELYKKYKDASLAVDSNKKSPNYDLNPKNASKKKDSQKQNFYQKNGSKNVNLKPSAKPKNKDKNGNTN